MQEVSNKEQRQCLSEKRTIFLGLINRLQQSKDKNIKNSLILYIKTSYAQITNYATLVLNNKTLREEKEFNRNKNKMSYKPDYRDSFEDLMEK